MVTDIGDRQLVCPVLATIAELVWSVAILTQGGPRLHDSPRGALDCTTHPGGPRLQDSPRGPSPRGALGWVVSIFFTQHTISSSLVLMQWDIDIQWVWHLHSYFRTYFIMRVVFVDLKVLHFRPTGRWLPPASWQ